MPKFLYGWLLFIPLAATHPAWADGEVRSGFAITANGAPVLEFYRDHDGTARYQLNDDLALGISLGLSPIHLARTAGGTAINTRWLPIFDLYRTPEESAFLLPDQSVREAQARQWFWALGTNTNVTADAFDFQGDFVQHFSLQTKAGFLMPLGRRWLLGGALTLDLAPGSDNLDPSAPRDRGTSFGAFLGVEFSY